MGLGLGLGLGVEVELLRRPVGGGYHHKARDEELME